MLLQLDFFWALPHNRSEDPGRILPPEFDYEVSKSGSLEDAITFSLTDTPAILLYVDEVFLVVLSLVSAFFMMFSLCRFVFQWLLRFDDDKTCSRVKNSILKL